MNARIRGAGLAIGVGIIVAGGFLGTSGQFVPGGPGPDALAGAGLTSSNGKLVLNVPTVTCTNGQAVTSVASTGAGTCGNTAPNSYGVTHLDINDEYFYSSCANASACGSWTSTTSGTGAVIAGTGANAGARPGVLEFRSGTTTTGLVLLQSRQDAFDFGSYTTITEELTGGVPVLSTAVEEFSVIVGFGDANTIDQVDGCYFLYDRGNIAAAPTTGAGNTTNLNDWSCVCASNSVRTEYVMDGAVVSDESFTTVSTPIAVVTWPSTNVFSLKLVMTAATRAEFYVDSGSGYTKRCDINTHIPSGAARFTGFEVQMLKSAGTTLRSFDIDRTRLALDWTTARSP